MKGKTQVIVNIVGLIITIWVVALRGNPDPITGALIFTWGVLLVGQFLVWAAERFSDSPDTM